MIMETPKYTKPRQTTEKSLTSGKLREKSITSNSGNSKLQKSDIKDINSSNISSHKK